LKALSGPAYQSSRKDMTQKAELFRAEQKKKQKDLFAELEKKLKKGSAPNNTTT